MQKPGNKKSRCRCSSPADCGRKRPKDADGGHLGECEVPAAAPEFAQARGIEWRAKERPTIDACQAPHRGEQVKDTEVQEQAQSRQSQSGGCETSGGFRR